MSGARRRLRPRPALLALGFVLLGAPAAADPPALDGPERSRQEEPVPPVVFFEAPDPVTAAEIGERIDAFGDQNRVGPAREELVWRYHLWSVPPLVDVLNADGANQTRIWNAVLTLAALRQSHGTSPLFGPALEPLLRNLEAREIYRRAFAALAFGCFHPPEMEIPDRRVQDRLEVSRVQGRRRDLEEAEAQMIGHLRDPNAPVRTSALLALAKRGGSSAFRDRVLDAMRGDEAVSEPMWAALLARAFLADPDSKPLFAALAVDDSRLQRAAALSIAVAMLIEDPPAWTRRVDEILHPLETLNRSQIDGPEVVFAWGVAAWQNQLTDEWNDLWKIAITPATETDQGVAAMQTLLFSRMPWLEDAAARWARSGDLDPEVLAACLLLAGRAGTEDGVEACRLWLSSPGRAPRPDPRWDVRFYAAVGLLRALHRGLPEDPELRERAVGALRVAVERGLARDAPFRAALAAVLDAEAPLLLRDVQRRLSGDALRAVETAFDDEHAYLSADIVDVCAHRVNGLMHKALNLDSIRSGSAGNPARTEMPQRHLRTWLEHYPYFTRLEFLARRGWREPSAIDGPEGMVFDR